MSKNITLTSCQKECSDKLLSFLMSKHRVFYLYGEAGTGKTFLIKELIDNLIPTVETTYKLLGKNVDIQYVITATTNKALAAINYPCTNKCTVYSYFNIKVGMTDENGEKPLIYPEIPARATLTPRVVIIDECSMLPREVFEYLFKTYPEYKFVLVGDPYQLPPIRGKGVHPTETYSQVAYLHTFVRNKNSKELQDLCSYIRSLINTDVQPTIKLSNSVRRINNEELDKLLSDSSLFNNSNYIALTYTNNKAIDYCNYIEKKDTNKEFYREGRTYINNNYNAQCYSSRYSLITDEPVVIKALSPVFEYTVYRDIKLKTSYVFIKDSTGRVEEFLLALDPKERKQCFDKVKRTKNKYAIRIVESTLDLRLPYACTIHKSQGSTYQHVIIDLDSFNKCRDNKQLINLLYVAVSRAATEVLFYGTDNRIHFS